MPAIAWVVLGLGATVNLGVAFTLAVRQPHRASDLATMYEWCRDWMFYAGSLYLGPEAATDYPPNAVVMLSPLALIPWRWLVPMWAAIALALTPSLPYLIARAILRVSRPAALFATLLFCCWASARTLLQFSLLSLVLAGVSAALADSSPRSGGIALGLALAKPHIAGPVALWALCTRRYRIVLLAAGVALGLSAAYDLRLPESPLATWPGYARVLESIYSGSQGAVGRTSIRAWTNAVADAPWADVYWLCTSGALLIVLCAMTSRDVRQASGVSGRLAAPATFCLWSLLTFYHNANNLILMLPAFLFVMFVDDRGPTRQRWIAIAILQVALMGDVPMRLEFLAPASGRLRFAISNFDRFLVLGTLVYVIALWRQVLVWQTDTGSTDPLIR